MEINKIIEGDIRIVATELQDQSVDCIVSSPPYWGLRDYGHDGQIGLEPTPEQYVETMVSIFRELRRVLKDEGTLWLNLGDSYAGNNSSSGENEPRPFSTLHDGKGINSHEKVFSQRRTIGNTSLPPKNLIGIPWRVALALQADGWYLRSDIIWAKSNPMPESVTDRPTKAHEYIFLLSKSARYYYDNDAIKEPQSKELGSISVRTFAYQEQNSDPKGGGYRGNGGLANRTNNGWRNKRTVWTVSTKPYSGAHFAVFPPDLIEPCILAGCPPAGLILDPFFGSGTVGEVCIKTGRNWLGVEINPDYIELANQRIKNTPIPLMI